MVSPNEIQHVSASVSSRHHGRYTNSIIIIIIIIRSKSEVSAELKGRKHFSQSVRSMVSVAVSSGGNNFNDFPENQLTKFRAL